MNRDVTWFKKAAHMSNMSTSSITYVGCVAVYKGHIIGYGCNMDKTHPMQKKYNHYRNEWNNNGLSTIHAEMATLIMIKNTIGFENINPTKVKLYVYRQKKDGTSGMSRPCNACMKAIIDCGIKDIYYTTDSGFAHEHLENCILGGVA